MGADKVAADRRSLAPTTSPSSSSAVSWFIRRAPAPNMLARRTLQSFISAASFIAARAEANRAAGRSFPRWRLSSRRKRCTAQISRAGDEIYTPRLRAVSLDCAHEGGREAFH